MGLKPDNWIKKMALEHRMIEPFEEAQVRDGVISFGTSSYGYDIRVAENIRFSPMFFPRLWTRSVLTRAQWLILRVRCA